MRSWIWKAVGWWWNESTRRHTEEELAEMQTW
jgi:hypothetical protein